MNYSLHSLGGMRIIEHGIFEHLANKDAEAGAIVNTGLQLPYWTNDVWRATPHRVVSRSAAEADESRYSIACFIDPDADAPVAVDERFSCSRARHRGTRRPPGSSLCS